MLRKLTQGYFYVAGSTFYGTNCYSEQTCLLSAQTEVCIAVAQDQLSGAITEGETIS